MKWRVRKLGAKDRLKKMKKNLRKIHHERAMAKWHKWYAWHPVRVPTNGRMSGMTMCWLGIVERRGQYFDCLLSTPYWTWQYRGKS